MSLIQVSNLTFAYDGSYDNIFENVSFQLDTDWRLGFTGRNGRGKTTFLNLLLGKYEYSGSISASVDFAYFPYPVPDKHRMTMEIVEEIYPDWKYWQLAREMNGLEVDDEVLYRPFETLSNGEQTKILLAVLFLKENNFLLIDEPTNHLDMHGREVVSRYLRRKQGFILVSHDRVFLDSCVDHILSINKTDIVVQKGNFSSWLHNKELQDNFERAENTRLQKDITHLQEAARKISNWSDRVEATKIGSATYDRGYIGHKAAKMMQRSKAIEARQQTAINEKSKLLRNIERADALKIFQTPYHKNLLVQLKNVSISYSETPVCSGISFTIQRGDRIALQGPNGSGKSSIIKLICGKAVPHTGEVSIGSGLQISCVFQDTSQLEGTAADYAAREGIQLSLFQAVLSQLDLSQTQFTKRLEDFSDGQKKKVLIARSLCQPTHLHIWDEPMNYIDVISRMQIEQLLLQFQPTILFVEHDRAFCENIATKTVQLSP